MTTVPDCFNVSPAPQLGQFQATFLATTPGVFSEMSRKFSAVSVGTKDGYCWQDIRTFSANFIMTEPAVVA